MSPFTKVRQAILLYQEHSKTTLRAAELDGNAGVILSILSESVQRTITLDPPEAHALANELRRLARRSEARRSANLSGDKKP